MRAEMPKRYWRNLPEAALIPALLAQRAGSAREAMLAERAREPPRKRIRPVRAAAAAASAPQHASRSSPGRRAPARAARCTSRRPRPCSAKGRRTRRWCWSASSRATRRTSPGRPFVGPAGPAARPGAGRGRHRPRPRSTSPMRSSTSSSACAASGASTRRPTRHEIEHCRWWLERELELVRPRLMVALGATAARGAARPAGRGDARARPAAAVRRTAIAGLITVHPSFLLRLPDAAAQGARARALRRRSPRDRPPRAGGWHRRRARSWR